MEDAVALGLYGPEGLQWAGGGNAAGVSVFVFLPGTTTKAALFLDNEGDFSLANPVTSDQTGRIAFYAEQGAYDLVINSTRFAINVSDNIGDPPPKLVQLGDVLVTSPQNNQALVWETVSGRWKNKTISGGGGGGAVDSVFGRTGDVVAENGDYTAGQVGAAPTVHTHGTGDVTGLNAFVTAIANAAATAAVNAVIASAPGTLDTLDEIAAALGDDPNFATTITNLIATKQNADADLTAIAALAPADGSLIQRISGVWNSQTTDQLKTSMNFVKADVGLPNVDNTSDVNKPVSTAQGVAIAARAFQDRVVRSADHSKQGAGDTYDMPNTSGAWALFTGPTEYSIAAAIGDDIEIAYNVLIAGAVTSFIDLVVVTGGTPTPQRYLGSGISTPTFQGCAGNYPSDANFQGRSGTLGFVVQAGDLDSGNIRVRWTIKTSNTNGKMYANDNYPLMLRIRNTRLSGS